MRLEIVSVTLSFGASSLYWLVSALRMDAAVYGGMMQLQALLLTCVAVFSLRTHDLVFHLQAHHGRPLRTAYLGALQLELALTVIGSACCLVLALLGVFGLLASSGVSPALWAAAALLANLTILQGASAAYLRGSHLDRRVAWADLLTALAWGAALVSALTLRAPATWWILGIGFAAGAVRPLALTGFALTGALWQSPDQPAVNGNLPPLNRRQLGRFLVAGQFTNLLKNNLLSLETLLLGRLAGADQVALFRVARSLLGLATVLLNISYQKAFRALAASKEAGQRQQVIRRMTRSSLKLWAGSLPIVFAAGLLFVHLKGGPHYNGLVLVLAVAALAALPLALQQSDFAALSLDGQFARINLAYSLAFGLLLVGCLVWADRMSALLFLALSAVAGLLRFALLRWPPTQPSQPTPR